MSRMRIALRHGSSASGSGSLPTMSAWGAGAPGILSLPSGRLVRGRGLRRPLPDDTLPEFGVYLLNKRPEPETSGWRSPAAGAAAGPAPHS